MPLSVFSWRRFLLFSAGSFLYLFLMLNILGPGGRDDVYKTLWPAWTWSQQGEILNYNGEVMEQSSSLLQVLLTGSVHAVLGGDIVPLNVDILMVVMALTAGFLAASLRSRWWWALALLVCGPWLYWGLAGMDAVLAGASLLWLAHSGSSVLAGAYRPWRVFPAALVFALVRPEAGLVMLAAILATAGWALFRRQLSQQLAGALAWVLAAPVLVLALRMWAFGMPLPYPAMAKGGLAWYQGLRYAYYTCWENPAVLILIGLAAWEGVSRMREGDHGRRWPVWLAGIYLLFIVLSGGDWMENGRFFVPVLPLLFFLALERLSTVNVGRYAVMALVLIQVLGLVQIQHHRTTSQSASWLLLKAPYWVAERPWIERANKIHYRDMEMIKVMDEVMERLEGPRVAKLDRPVRIMSQQAGMVMFYLAQRHQGKFEFIDLVGLSSTHFHDCSLTKDRGHGFGGLNMDYFYLFGAKDSLLEACDFRTPDIIFDLDNERWEKVNFLQEQGYYIAFQKGGWLDSGRPSFPGLEVGLWQFVAVRHGLFDHQVYFSP